MYRKSLYVYEKGGHVGEKGKEGGHVWRGRNNEDKYREEGIKGMFTERRDIFR